MKFKWSYLKGRSIESAKFWCNTAFAAELFFQGTNHSPYFTNYRINHPNIVHYLSKEFNYAVIFYIMAATRLLQKHKLQVQVEIMNFEFV